MEDTVFVCNKDIDRKFQLVHFNEIMRTSLQNDFNNGIKHAHYVCTLYTFFSSSMYVTFSAHLLFDLFSRHPQFTILIREIKLHTCTMEGIKLQLLESI
jgi:hypothetical protein